VFEGVSFDGVFEFSQQFQGVFDVSETIEVVIDEILEIIVKFGDFYIEFNPISIESILSGITEIMTFFLEFF
jgi:hypothetical protein